MTDMPISFPGLFGDWEWNPDPIAIHIGHGIYWYGIILAVALLAGLTLSMKQAKRYGLTEDNILDLVLWSVPCCIVGARLYYVVFYLDLYRNGGGGLDWSRVIAVWDGGIAIYGAVIAAVLVVFFYTRHKKLPFGALSDVGVLGLLLGQAIGRWANFINREAFGGATDLPWRMRLWFSSFTSADVHPTFLYESLWNLVGLVLILCVVAKGRRFDGENTWFYFLWYGLGRSWIEGLRADSLYLFDWKLLGQPIRVSQALSVVLVVVSACALFYNIRIRKRTAEGLLVNRLAAQAAGDGPEGSTAEAPAAEEGAENASTVDTEADGEQEQAPEMKETAENAAAPEEDDTAESTAAAAEAPADEATAFVETAAPKEDDAGEKDTTAQPGPTQESDRPEE